LEIGNVGTLSPEMEAAWVDFLRAPGAGGHAVQVYAELDELAESVAAYLATGFAAGEPAVVVVTGEHQVTFDRFLAEAGWDVEVLGEAGLLVTLDAEQTLASLFEEGALSALAFERVVGGVIDGLTERFPNRRVRAFGEMVDLLTARGEPDTAAALERLWNDLTKTRSFSLLCGYRLDVFDPESQQLLPAVCSAHTHVRPAYDMARLDRAVHAALDEVLGTTNARMVKEIVRDGAAKHSAPVSEQMLMWVSDRMPRHAERVLAAARAKYEPVPVV
jgi:KaiC/GvpD/RAD55 family RecA-like ATPase